MFEIYLFKSSQSFLTVTTVTEMEIVTGPAVSASKIPQTKPGSIFIWA